MIRFLKYFFSFVIVLLALGAYLLFTDSGKIRLYPILSKVMSERTDMKIKVLSLDVDYFPHIFVKLLVSDAVKLTLTGNFKLSAIDLDYTLKSHCIASDICTIDDDVSIRGHARGDFKKIFFEGKGRALKGYVSFEGMKFRESVEDFKLSLRQVSSSKLFTLLGQEALIEGRADADVVFEFMDETHKRGSFSYDVYDHNFLGMPLALHTEVQIEDMQHTFMMDIDAPSAHIKVRNGSYNQKTKKAKASYVLNITDLKKLETLLGYGYLGKFYAKGEVLYNDALSVTGYSNSYGGVLEYVFQNAGLTVGLHDVSFKAFMEIFPYQPILDANTTGNIFYNIRRKTVIVNAQLDNAKLLRSSFSKNIYKKSRIKLYKETFNKSNLDAAYYNGTFTADIRLQDRKNHAYLTRTIVNTRNNTIHTYFDLRMQKKAYTGRVYGDFNNPTVDLDTKKAIFYQMQKKLDAVLGKKNRKRVEKLVAVFPLGNTAKDMVSEAAASFVDMLF
jgi:hypothetical protein